METRIIRVGSYIYSQDTSADTAVVFVHHAGVCNEEATAPNCSTSENHCVLGPVLLTSVIFLYKLTEVAVLCTLTFKQDPQTLLGLLALSKGE